MPFLPAFIVYNSMPFHIKSGLAQGRHQVDRPVLRAISSCPRTARGGEVVRMVNHPIKVVKAYMVYAKCLCQWTIMNLIWNQSFGISLGATPASGLGNTTTGSKSTLSKPARSKRCVRPRCRNELKLLTRENHGSTIVVKLVIKDLISSVLPWGAGWLNKCWTIEIIILTLCTWWINIYSHFQPTCLYILRYRSFVNLFMLLVDPCNLLTKLAWLRSQKRWETRPCECLNPIMECPKVKTTTLGIGAWLLIRNLSGNYPEIAQVLPDLVKFMDNVHQKMMTVHRMNGQLEIEAVELPMSKEFFHCISSQTL